MRVDVPALMEQAVTVANRVPATGSGSEDAWSTTVLTAFWHEEGGGSVSGSSYGVTSGTASIRVQVAEEDADGYVEPDAYDGDGWTLRPGDKVVDGSISFSGTLSDLLDACEGLRVGTVTKAEDLRLDGATVPLRGISKWASIIYCEAS